MGGDYNTGMGGVHNGWRGWGVRGRACSYAQLLSGTHTCTQTQMQTQKTDRVGSKLEREKCVFLFLHFFPFLCLPLSLFRSLFLHLINTVWLLLVLRTDPWHHLCVRHFGLKDQSFPSCYDSK